MLLPYMEQQSMFNAFNFANGCADERCGGLNTTVTRNIVNGFNCPSDSDKLSSVQGHNNYMGNAGSAPNSFYGGRLSGANNFGSNPSQGANGIMGGVFCFVGVACDNGPAPPCGPANGQSIFKLGMADITDGLSNTACMSERVKGLNSNNSTQIDPRVPSASLFNLPKGVNVDGRVDTGDGGPQAFYNLCKGLNIGKLTTKDLDGQDSSGARWDVGYAPDTRYNHVMPPNSYNCDGDNDDAGRQTAYGASSRHPGGVNVMMCDGSVKFIKSTVGTTPWWGLGTRGGNEVISSDAY
jgi:prepilin-type processing-associated H-X9-DG protein